MRDKRSFVYLGFILIFTVIVGFYTNVYNYGSEAEADTIKEHPYVLVINAYHQGFGWTDDQTGAIIESFSQLEDTVVSIEYLDWKRYPHEENLEQQFNYLKYKYAEETIDVVIATDDIGMQFAIDYRDELFPGTPIVFTAVFEESAKQRMTGIDNITGVYEGVDVVGTVTAMRGIHPNLEHAYIISDHGESGLGLSEQLVKAIKQVDSSINTEVLNNHTYTEIRDILAAPLENSVVIMGSYNMDIQGNTIPVEMFTRELSETVPVPIYSLYEYLFDTGITGGSLLSGRLQGEVGASLAKEILSGTPIDEIPIVNEKTVFYGFDYEQMEKHDIAITQLPDASQLINKPVSIFDEYKTVIISFFSIMILLIAFIIILSVNVGLRRRAQAALEKEHEEVLLTYEALAASEEELKAQNEELIEQQERINYLAYNDHLTDLPNRLQVKNYSSILIEKSKLHNSKMILVFIDLDNFNYVNTAHGHMIGDMMLRRLSNRFKNCLGGQGVMGRIGGDEFVCLRGYDDNFDAEGFIEDLMSVFEEPVEVNNREVHVTASMGYAIYPDDGNTYDELLIRADMAMYKMKDNGKAQASRFDVQMNKEMTSKISLTNALKTALANNEFSLMYQPQYNFEKKKIVGFEALLRWNSATLGFVPPNVFIPVTESTGSIVEIGYYVIDEAAKFANKLKDSGIEGKVSVNISVIQLLRNDFSKRVREILGRHDVSPSQIEFEITESVMIESFEVVNRQLKKIRNLGIQLALDDFGTGYSSLTYLKKLPLSTLKIDKQFIDDILSEGEGHFFTGTIIDLANRLGFRVVAEGVEKDEQIDYLKGFGCDTIQGYWFSRPVDDVKALDMFGDTMLV